MIAVGPVRLRSHGSRLAFEIALQSIWTVPQHLAVALAVESPRSRKAARREVFRLAMLDLDADQSETLRGSVGLAAVPAGQVASGRHRLDLLVNGVAFPLGGFPVARRRTRRSLTSTS